MNNLKVGFSRVNINPMLGIPVTGYYQYRVAEKILDDLEIVTVALECGEKRAVMISVDTLHLHTFLCDEFKGLVAEKLNIPTDAVYIHSTHTHTGPAVAESDIRPDAVGNVVEPTLEYQQLLRRRIVDAAVNAVNDLKPAKMGFGRGKAPNVAFVRRYVMKDGSVRTNPGVNNPDIVRPVGETDDTVSVIRFDREGATSVAIVNFGNHPDVIGGNNISADWPGITRGIVEKVLDNTSCIVLNGTQGDVNHVNVHPTGGYLNDTFIDFDDVSRGYKHSQYIAKVVTGGVLQAWDKVEYKDVESINFVQKTVNLPSNMPTKEELEKAYHIDELAKAGRSNELPYEGMMLTTVVAEAQRMVKLKDGPEAFPMTFSALSIGNVAFFGIPGEPFNDVGRQLKETEGWDMILPTCLTNGAEGYFPMKDSYDEGGYEARSSRFKAGVAELIVKEGKDILNSLKK